MRRRTTIIAILAVSVICGCAGIKDSASIFTQANPWWRAAQTDEISASARTLEERGELAMALDRWRVVERIAMDKARARREIARLETVIAETVASHYEKGLQKIGEKADADARNHFLAALRLDPFNREARQQLKANFSPFPLTVYRTESGEHPSSIAKKHFHDPKKAFLVTWFNDLEGDEEIPPDTLLILPKLEKVQPTKKPKKQPPNQFLQARMRLAADDIEGALALSGDLDAADPAVQSLTHSIYLRQAAIQTEAGHFEAARQSLDTIPDGFKGKDIALDRLQAAIREQQITADLEKAQAFFKSKAYLQSLDLAEEVHRRAPDNKEAQALATEARYQLARQYYENKKLLSARTVLEQADENHDASMKLKQAVHEGLVQQAQIHYRQGVKAFINEDLEAAVKQWEKALTCNPDHAKARENIENAKRLMQKLEKMP
jgi:hypothetical protein